MNSKPPQSVYEIKAYPSCERTPPPTRPSAERPPTATSLIKRNSASCLMQSCCGTRRAARAHRRHRHGYSRTLRRVLPRTTCRGRGLHARCSLRRLVGHASRASCGSRVAGRRLRSRRRGGCAAARRRHPAAGERLHPCTPPLSSAGLLAGVPAARSFTPPGFRPV